MTPVSQPAWGAAEREALEDVALDGAFALGPSQTTFETGFAALGGHRHAVACSSGTAALHLALTACGLGPGDEVIVPACTYVATANAVRQTGATVVLVDVLQETWGINPWHVEAAITPKTRAILAVDLYGVLADYPALRALASRYGLRLIEDAAQALGLPGAGISGDLGTFSFYGNKLITTGEGGMVVTPYADLALAVSRLRSHGSLPGEPGYYSHRVAGFNYRLSNLASALGLAQVRMFPERLRARQAVCGRYTQGVTALVPPVGVAAPWLWTGVARSREAAQRIQAALKAQDIETRPVFPCLATLPMYATPGTRYPVAEHLATCGVSLPTFGALGRGTQNQIITTVNAYG